MSINRRANVPFAQISNTALRDARLSFRARGILAMVLSNAEEWDAPRDWIVASGTEGRAAVQTALNELTALGYRVVTKERRPDGKIVTVVNWHHEPSDVRETDSRVSGRPVTSPSSRRPSQKTMKKTPSSSSLRSSSSGVGGSALPLNFPIYK